MGRPSARPEQLIATGAASRSRWFPAEREQLSRTCNEWAADPMPYRALTDDLEEQFDPLFRDGQDPRPPAPGGAVTRDKLRNCKRLRIRYDECFAARALIGQYKLDGGTEILDRKHRSFCSEPSEG